MERVAFIVEETGERIPCLLNPERVVHRRHAGLRPLVSGSGAVSGPTLTDTPLLHTGGGRTEIDLELLFDVQLAEAVTTAAVVPSPATAAPGAVATPRPPAPPDVRRLTRPLWDLAENTGADSRSVPRVRFVWGKAWNVPAVVESFAERLERFDQGGVPGRSWVRMRLVRVPETEEPPADDLGSLTGPVPDADLVRAIGPVGAHVVVGAGAAGAAGGAPSGGPAAGGETLPQIVAQHTGDRPWLWRAWADLNDLVDVVWPPPGTVLAVPPTPEQVPPPSEARP